MLQGQGSEEALTDVSFRLAACCSWHDAGTRAGTSWGNKNPLRRPSLRCSVRGRPAVSVPAAPPHCLSRTVVYRRRCHSPAVAADVGARGVGGWGGEDVPVGLAGDQGLALGCRAAMGLAEGRHFLRRGVAIRAPSWCRLTPLHSRCGARRWVAVQRRRGMHAACNKPAPRAHSALGPALQPAGRPAGRPPPSEHTHPRPLTCAVFLLLHDEAAVLGADAPRLGLQQRSGRAALRWPHPRAQQAAVAAAAVGVAAAIPAAALVAVVAPARALALVVLSRAVRRWLRGGRRGAAGREGGQLGPYVGQRGLGGGGRGLRLEHVRVRRGGLRQAVDGGDDSLRGGRGRAGQGE